jgi:hypothetical protein
MSKRILPKNLDADQARTQTQVEREAVSTPTVFAIKDPSGRVRVRIGLIAGRYGVRVYDNTGAVSYDFTVTP